MRRRLFWSLLILVAVFGGLAWFYLLREVETHFADDGENFKYGSFGVEAANGVPYWIWYVMPQVCEGRPVGRDGYERFGLLWEDGKEAPVGLPMKTVGFRRLGVNCGLCHIGTLRDNSGSDPQVLLGAPSTRFDLQAYLRFLYSCADDDSFNPEQVLASIAEVHDLPLVERLLYRYIVIPQMKEALLTQKAQLAWMDGNPDSGPGRADPFNPAKVQILGLPFDGTIGNSDIVPLWNFAPREGFSLHWDGLNDSLREIVLNSGIGNGASNKTLDLAKLKRIEDWVLQLPPPPYPYPIDRALAANGETVWLRECASCHAFGSAQTGQAVRMESLGTDNHRLSSWSSKVADGFNGLDQYRWLYTHFRPSFGYVAVGLDGIWARAPYLHNGSVPTLWDLLKPPESRPKTFYRGNDHYDQGNVGFEWRKSRDGDRNYFYFDTTLLGNSNRGHRYGTELQAAEKQALIEYLKTM